MNPRRKRRRRRRNAPRRRYVLKARPRRRRRGALMRYMGNAPRRRARVGVLPGLPPVAQMLPPVAAGIAGGFTVGWGGPMVSQWFGIAPVGFMYRLIQAGVAWLGAWALASSRMVDRPTAVAFGTGGSVIAGLAFISDWQRGLVTAAPAAAPAEVSGLGQDEYDAMVGYYEPYGTGPTMGYYEAVA